jgi:outer membrane lipoprotein-sorting protein
MNMSKLLSGIAIASLLIGLTGTTQAQVPPASPTPTPQSQPSSPAPSTANTPDLSLLTKAVGIFWQTDRAETKSQMTLDVAADGSNIKMYAQIETIAQTGNKFVTKLTFTSPGETKKSSYKIVSNGKKVWIYRIDRRQYIETTFAKFNDSSDSFWIGTSSFLFTSLNETERREMTAALGSDRNILTTLLKGQTGDLQGRKQQLDGEELYNYSYDNKKENWTFNGLIQPQTGILKQIEIAGKSQGMTFSIADKIISRNTQPTISSQTFRFSPPRGVKKVKALEIDPFNSK